MPVITIPFHQDPRRRAPSPSYQPYSFDEHHFPALPGVERANEHEDLRHMVKWPQIVNGGLVDQSGEIGTATKKSVQDRDAASDCQLTNITSSSASGMLVQKTFQRFLELPKETRLVVWDLAIRDQRYATPAGSGANHLSSTINLREYVNLENDPARPAFLPIICLTSKKTMEETVAVFIEGSTFMVASIKDNKFLQAFLKATTGRLNLCRRLYFDYFGRFPAGYEKNADLELAVECTGLRAIKLTFHHQSLIYMVSKYEYGDVLTYVPHSGSFLFEKYRLKRLLDCHMLQTVTIEHTGYYSEKAIVAAETLGELIVRSFAERPKKQIVDVQYTRRPRRPWYYTPYDY